METNWIILAIVLVCVTGLILFLVLRDQKDKKEVIKYLNHESDVECDSELNKEKE